MEANLPVIWATIIGIAVAMYVILDGFDLTREECEAIVMQARLKAGWVTEADLAPPPEAPAEAADAAAPAE